MAATPLTRPRPANRDVSVEVIVLAVRNPLLKVHVITNAPESAVVQVVGEIDLTNADAVADILSAQGDAGRPFVRLDVSGLTFCDCAGLSAITRAHSRLLARGGTLVLTGVGTRFARLLAISRLDTVLLVADGLDDPPHTRHSPAVPANH